MGNRIESMRRFACEGCLRRWSRVLARNGTFQNDFYGNPIVILLKRGYVAQWVPFSRTAWNSIVKGSTRWNPRFQVEARMVKYWISASHCEMKTEINYLLARNSNRHREYCCLPCSTAMTIRQLTQARLFLARRAIRLAGPLASPLAHSSGRKAAP